MPTFLFNEIIFGPVRSRRLGVSLGVNLLPLDKKWCNFDCIYCECGWSCKTGISRKELPERKLVARDLELKISGMLESGTSPDVITFAGNGEPTLHPDFSGIIDDTLMIRDRLCPAAEVAVLSNAIKLDDPSVKGALTRVEQNILKLDTAIEETYRFINRPGGNRTIDWVIDQLCRFEGKMIIQSLFFRGTFKGRIVDNTTEEELIRLFEAYQAIRPDRIMVYTFDRDTPVNTLEKVPPYELEAIAKLVEQLGFPADVYA
jgi:wyosine [tRNA(Phe)-imidazoG37] synthetase (radical SAM superfamily)